MVGEVPGDKEKLLYESCVHPEEEAIYFRVGTSIFCYEMNLGIVDAIYKSERIPADSENELSEYPPCLVNFCEGYNLDDVRNNQSERKQWCSKKVRDK